jgi:hypothetical protein
LICIRLAAGNRFSVEFVQNQHQYTYHHHQHHHHHHHHDKFGANRFGYVKAGQYPFNTINELPEKTLDDERS